MVDSGNPQSPEMRSSKEEMSRVFILITMSKFDTINDLSRFDIFRDWLVIIEVAGELFCTLELMGGAEANATA